MEFTFKTMFFIALLALPAVSSASSDCSSYAHNFLDTPSNITADSLKQCLEREYSKPSEWDIMVQGLNSEPTEEVPPSSFYCIPEYQIDDLVGWRNAEFIQAQIPLTTAQELANRQNGIGFAPPPPPPMVGPNFNGNF